MMVRGSVGNFETVLPVGRGSRGDFPEVGYLDWLLEGRAGFELWRAEGTGRCRVGSGTAAKAGGVRSRFTEGSDCPGLEAVGRNPGRAC